MWQFIKCMFGFHPKEQISRREAIFGYADYFHYKCHKCGDTWSGRY